MAKAKKQAPVKVNAQVSEDVRDELRALADKHETSVQGIVAAAVHAGLSQLRPMRSIPGLPPRRRPS